jgi:hypothetical protein
MCGGERPPHHAQMSGAAAVRIVSLGTSGKRHPTRISILPGRCCVPTVIAASTKAPILWPSGTNISFLAGSVAVCEGPQSGELGSLKFRDSVSGNTFFVLTETSGRSGHSPDPGSGTGMARLKTPSGRPICISDLVNRLNSIVVNYAHDGLEYSLQFADTRQPPNSYESADRTSSIDLVDT